MPWTELARQIGVSMPYSEMIIDLFNALCGRDFRTEGITMGRLGLAGKNLDEIRKLVERGER